MNIYSYLDYRKYLNASLITAGKKSGIKAKAAEAIRSQPPYLSRVLSGQADLSLEQADSMSRFLSHSPEEHHYFLLLVQKERAGSASLKSYFIEQLEGERLKRQNITHQVKPSDLVSREAESRYYSSWIYGAVHVFVSIEGAQTPSVIASALHVPLTVVKEVLRFLVTHGLVKEKKDRYSVGKSHVHLRNDSELVARHHLNWRLLTMERLIAHSSQNLHYSGVATLDEATASLLRENLVQNLKSNLQQIEKAPSKAVYVYNLDFFELARP
jgi:uncharacterized protein (TIGR02147 family)